ncbi:MAG: nitroreductase family protein [Chloroflexi bacterium]|nr:nitroreductase family protein [Chloroflexota bacterium]
MDFQDVVRKRRMVRSFESQPLPDDVVERIVRNAQRAPSAGFSQGWAFLVLDGPEQTRAYWDAVGPTDADAFRWQDLFKAPLLIVCLSHKHAYLERYAEADKGWTDRSESHWPAPYWDIDTGMAALLMLLTAVDAGLGALFFGVPPDKIPMLREAFGIPAELSPIGTVAVGYPKADDPPSPSLQRGHRPAAEVIHRGRW